MEEKFAEMAILNRLVDSKSFTPVFTKHIQWPFQRCRISAECVTTRKLTLLEKFILRAFNEIDDVSAEEIARQLGLFEPMLIESTVDNLREGGSLEVTEFQQDDESDDEYDLYVYDDEDIVAETEDVFKTWKKKLSEGMTRLKNLRGKVTKRGKLNLQRGKIDNPPENKTFKIWRSLIDGSLIAEGNILVEKQSHEIDSSNWVPYDTDDLEYEMVSALSDSDVFTVIKETRKLGTELEIRAQYMLDSDETDIVAFDLFVSLFLNQDGSLQWKVTDDKVRELEKLSFEIAKESTMIDEILNWASIKSPGVKPSEIATHSCIPYQIRNQTVEEIIERAKVIILGEDAHEHFKFADKNNSEKDSIKTSNAAIFSVGSKQGLTQSDTPFRRNLKTTIVPKKSLLSDAGSIVVESIIIDSNEDKFNIPICIKDKTLFSPTRKQLSAKLDQISVFRMEPSLDRLEFWVQSTLAETELKEIKKVTKEFLLHAEDSGLKDSTIIQIAIVGKLRNTLESLKMTKANINQVLEISKQLYKELSFDIWPSLEGDLRSQCLSSKISTNSMEVWSSHQQGRKVLSLEDAARLENEFFGHCNSAYHRFTREMESIIKKLGRSHGIKDESLFEILQNLFEENIIDKGFYEKLNTIRRSRNEYVHGRDNTAQLDATLKAIGVIRKLLSKKELKGVWSQDKKQMWDTHIEYNELQEIVKLTIEIIIHIKSQELPVNGDVWVKPLVNHIPNQKTGFDFELLNLLSNGPSVSKGYSLEQIEIKLARSMLNGEEISDKTVKSILSKGVPKDIHTLWEQLHKAGLDKIRQEHIKKIFSKIPTPRSIKEVISQSETLKPLENELGSNVLEGHWNKAFNQEDFSCPLSEILVLSATEEISLSQKTIGKLLRQALSEYINAHQFSQVKDYTAFSKKLDIILASGKWKQSLIKLDGWIGNTLYLQARSMSDKQRIALLNHITSSKKALLPEDLEKTNKQISSMLSGPIKRKKKKKMKKGG